MTFFSLLMITCVVMELVVKELVKSPPAECVQLVRSSILMNVIGASVRANMINSVSQTGGNVSREEMVKL